jgi:hypothetical protein
MAREANCVEASHPFNPWSVSQEALERFAALVAAAERNRTWTQAHWTEYERSIVAAEREACAKVAEKMLRHYTQAVTGVPESIRARGENA